MSKYKNIFLDFDDTLIDTQGFATKCLKELFDEHSLCEHFESKDIFLETYHKHTSKLWEDYALGLIDKETLLKDRFEKPFAHKPHIIGDFTTTLNNRFIEKVVQIDFLIDGACDLLSYLKQKNYKLVMLSNGFTEIQYQKIDKVGWNDFFDYIILSDVIGVNKPDPTIFQKALAISDSNVNESIMIGDSYLADIQGAMNINMDQIWFNPQHQPATQQPTYTVDKLHKIKSIL